MGVSSAVIARRRRAPLMALALVALFAGLWGGLIRLGLSLPSAVTSAAELHGPLMALGFLGTLVSLERAVALDRPWAYWVSWKRLTGNSTQVANEDVCPRAWRWSCVRRRCSCASSRRRKVRG